MLTAHAFRCVADYFDQPCLLVEFSGNIREANVAARRALSLGSGSIECSILDLLAPDGGPLDEYLKACSSSSVPKPAQFSFQTTKDAEMLYYCFTSRFRDTLDGEPMLFMRLSRTWGMRSKLAQLNRKVALQRYLLREQGNRHNQVLLSLDRVKRKVYIDQLTGLRNRNAYIDDFHKLEQSWKSQSMYYLAFLLIDLNNMKTVNDTLGHKMGDAMLQAFSNNLRQQFRDEDLIYRLGGDEFVCLFRNCDPVKTLPERLETIARKATRSCGVEVRFSSGIAFSREVQKLSDLYTIADRRMYTMKNVYKRHVV